MDYNEKINLAVQMANQRIEASRNSHGEVSAFLKPTAYKLSGINEVEIGNDLYDQIVMRMLDLINKLEKQ